MELSNVHVKVDWNSSSLWDEDHLMEYKDSSAYRYTISWDIPSFAPSGHYDITLTGLNDT